MPKMHLPYGEMLAYARKKAGLTQTEAARRAGISRQYLCQVEKGTRNPLPKSTGSRLCLAIGLDWELLRAAELLWYEKHQDER